MTISPTPSWCARLPRHTASCCVSVKVSWNPVPPTAFPKLRLSADNVSPTLNEVPNAVIVTAVTALPETTIVAFASFPDWGVVNGTSVYVPSA